MYCCCSPLRFLAEEEAAVNLARRLLMLVSIAPTLSTKSELMPGDFELEELEGRLTGILEGSYPGEAGLNQHFLSP